MTATTLRTLTCARLRTIEGYESKVYDSRTTAIGEQELPSLVVITSPGKVVTASLGGTRWNRTQTVVIYGEFEAKNDAALAARSDALELACWEALMGNQEWYRSWDHLLSWDTESGRDAESDKRRGVLKITITGDFAQLSPDPDDMAPLREIRASLGLDGTNQPTDPETRVQCAGDEE